ncbi:hypothetical protein [Niallia oryzisoli]|uniref:hypothetical protein n=1 Tax=Niallia oryzisoli TaxID=1737571 RepID=UPI00373678AA
MKTKTGQFVGGIFLTMAIFGSTFLIGLYSVLLWFLVLILFLVTKKHDLVKGMAIGVLVTLFIFFIVCGGLILFL